MHVSVSMYLYHNLYSCLCVQTYSVRGGKGDFVLGALIAQDFSTPFLSTVKILRLVSAHTHTHTCTHTCTHTHTHTCTHTHTHTHTHTARPPQISTLQAHWCSSPPSLLPGTSTQSPASHHYLCCPIPQLECAGCIELYDSILSPCKQCTVLAPVVLVLLHTEDCRVLILPMLQSCT